MSYRALQINELLREELNRLFLTELEFPEGCLITIIAVETSPDLRYAKVFVSVLPEKLTGTALERLRKRVRNIQNQLNKKLSIKPVPRISFVLDTTERQAASVDALIDKG